MKIYLVGGAVRDHLLGIPPRERDWVVVGSSPEAMVAQGFKPVGKDFPVFLHPETGEEYALARTERKSGKGYKGFTVYAAADVSLHDDLQRRDLTINAMAQDEAGNIIDPYGGQADLASRTLRHVSSAFTEDPLRVLRAARFAAKLSAYQFKFAPETAHLLRLMVAQGELRDLVPDRVWQEIEKALSTTTPQQFWACLRQVGALAVLLPEVDALFGVPNSLQWHPEIDSGLHTLMVVTQAARLTTDPAIRFAALLHDVGKALTSPSLWPHHHGHERAGVELVRGICERYPVPKQFRELALLTTQYHGMIHQAMSLSASDLVDLLQNLDAFRRPQRFFDICTAAEADSRGRPGYEDAAYQQSEFLREIHRVTAAIDMQTIINKGYQGAEISEQLRIQRIAEVSAIVASAQG